MIQSRPTRPVDDVDVLSLNKCKRFRFLFSRNGTADLIRDAFEFMYTPWPDNSDKYALRSQLVDLAGDYIYFAPSHEVADIHSKYATVYMYEFAHRSKTASIHPEWMGVAHGDNVAYDFGVPLILPGFDVTDVNVSLIIMGMYANFARSGDPNQIPLSGVTWGKYFSGHRAYLRVDANPKMTASFAARRIAFWNDYHPKLEQVKFETKQDIHVVNGAGARVTMAMLIPILLALTLTIF